MHIVGLVGLCFVIWIVNGDLRVQAPSKLAEFFSEKYEGGLIPYSIANYGDVPYGKMLSG